MRARPLVGFFDHPDVFEDFYPHLGVDQQAFATRWAATGNHALVRLIQRELADVVWYELSLRPRLRGAVHAATGCHVRLVRSSAVHRALWHAFYAPRGPWRFGPAYWVYAGPASYAAPLSRELGRALRADRPDLLFSQDYASGKFDVLLAVARALGVPLVACHSGSSPDRYVGRTARRFTLRAADHLIVPSRAERDMLVERFRADARRVSVIPTPIDTEALAPGDRRAARAALGGDPARRCVAYVGRLDDGTKRIGEIVHAFAAIAGRHADADLVIAGDGPDAVRLERLVRETLGPRGRMLGWVDGVRDVLNAAECLVLASRREGFPTVVGEAMACGTPVLATRVGALDEIVAEGRTGWLVEPGDRAALAARLDAILAAPDAVASMRPAVRAEAERRFAPAVVAGAVGAALDAALARRRG